MKTFLILAVVMFSSVNSFAGGCEGIDLKGKRIQLVPLDGGTDVIGTLDDEFFRQNVPGSALSPCIADPLEDGSFEWACYAADTRSEKLGPKVGSLGKLRLIETGRKGRTCEIHWLDGTETKKFKLVARSPKGDLVLSELGTAVDDVYGIEAPTMVLRMEKHRRVPNACPAGQIQTQYGCLFKAEGKQCPQDGKTYVIYQNQCVEVKADAAGVPGTQFQGAPIQSNVSPYQGASCPAGQVYTQYGCLPQGQCPANYGMMNGMCIPAIPSQYGTSPKQ